MTRADPATRVMDGRNSMGPVVGSGRISPSEADRIRFVAAADYARAVGVANPPCPDSRSSRRSVVAN